MEKGFYTCGIFVDLKKAFYTVDHSILLQKLQHYGTRGIVNNWFSSYLAGRSQITEVQSITSKQKFVHCSVSQRSVLGPVLFVALYQRHSLQKLNF